MILSVIVLLGMACGLFLIVRFPRLEVEPSVDVRQNCSIIIPARNEEDVLPTLLESLKNQTVKPYEIIVVDDGSNDRTAQIARSYDTQVVTVRHKDDSWTGKTFALQTGAQKSSGEIVVFLDADITAEPSFIERLTNRSLERGTVVSIQPYHKIEQVYEELSLLFNTLLFMGVGAFTLLGDRVLPSGSFGPALAMRRDDYFSLGGHSTVKGNVLEHFSLGALFEKSGFHQKLYSGKDLLSFRMYPHGVEELYEGWVKGFSSGASGSKPLFLGLSVFWITSLLLLPFLCLFTSSTALVLTAMSVVLLALILVQIFREIGNFSFFNFPFLSVHAVFFIVVFAISTIKVKVLKRVNWRGREVKL